MYTTKTSVKTFNILFLEIWGSFVFMKLTKCSFVVEKLLSTNLVRYYFICWTTIQILSIFKLTICHGCLMKLFITCCSLTLEMNLVKIYLHRSLGSFAGCVFINLLYVNPYKIILLTFKSEEPTRQWMSSSQLETSCPQNLLTVS